jgi:hypothetical protein
MHEEAVNALAAGKDEVKDLQHQLETIGGPPEPEVPKGGKGKTYTHASGATVEILDE